MNAKSFGDGPPDKDLSLPDDPFAIIGDADGFKRRSVHGSFATVLSQGAKMATLLGSQIILAGLLFLTDAT